MKKILLSALLMSALYGTTQAQVAINCAPNTARTTVLYCNNFDVHNTPWNSTLVYLDFDGELIDTKHGGQETKSPHVTVNGTAGPVLIRQYATVETIRLNNLAVNPADAAAAGGSYVDSTSTLGYAIGMVPGATGAPPPQADQIAFTFDAKDSLNNDLPFIIVELDAAAIPLMRDARSPTPEAGTVLHGVDAAPIVFSAYLFDEAASNTANLLPFVAAPSASLSQVLAPAIPKALGDSNSHYPIAWTKVRLKFDVPATNTGSANNMVTVMFDPDPTLAANGGYMIFDNLKITATDDSDGDGVPDAQEIIDGTDPNDPLNYLDTDGDLVPDYIEISDGTDPNNPADYQDTDGDRVPDYVETIRQPNNGEPATDATDPNSMIDTDNGGAPDYVETILLPNLGLPAGDINNAADDDSDGDGVPDAQEIIDGTDPNDPLSYLDTDGDLVPDFIEIRDGTDPNNPADYQDTDGDRVPDYVEQTYQPNNGQPITDATDPNSMIDTDNGGAPDYVETILLPNLGLPAGDINNAADDDSDGDGVPDAQEIIDGTDPNDPLSYLDTDGDLVPDFIEIRDGTNPNNPASYRDRDGDLVPDYVEQTYQPNNGQSITDATDPNSMIDTDGGGLPDYAETILMPNLGLTAGNPDDPSDDVANRAAILRALAPESIPVHQGLWLSILGLVYLASRRQRRR